jgi:hypothetical protein
VLIDIPRHISNKVDETAKRKGTTSEETPEHW